MKITNEKFESKLHVYVLGKGKNAEMRIKFVPTFYESPPAITLELDESKQFLHAVQKAVEVLEKRSQVKEDESDEDEDQGFE